MQCYTLAKRPLEYRHRSFNIFSCQLLKVVEEKKKSYFSFLFNILKITKIYLTLEFLFDTTFRIILSQNLVLSVTCWLGRSSAGFLPFPVLYFLFSVRGRCMEGSPSLGFGEPGSFLFHMTLLAVVIPWRPRAGRSPGGGRSRNPRSFRHSGMLSCSLPHPPQQCICLLQSQRIQKTHTSILQKQSICPCLGMSYEACIFLQM